MSTTLEMLPLAYNMDGSNGTNSFGQYDESVILNCVRSRKKVTELPNCPVCSCTIRQGELESHKELEIHRLQKLSAGSKRKISISSNIAVPGPSTELDDLEGADDQEVDVTGCLGSDVYQRVHGNRLKRLRARRSPTPQGQCPVCTATLPVARLQRHTLRCLKRTGASVDEDVPSSEEEGTIDVENDEEANESGFGSSYRWCGEWRVRAAALQPADARVGTSVRRASHDHPLVVDGDEDAELYGPPQYSPSRIAPDAEMSNANPQPEESEPNIEVEKPCKPEDQVAKSNGLIAASAETRIQALKAKIKDLEQKQNGLESKCLICLGPYISPAVSIQCWHVYCEECWLQSLHAKKICPQCNVITSAQHLRRIYM